jgi:hypothetical protein
MPCRWLHMPGMNTHVLRLLRRHLCLGQTFIDGNRKIVSGSQVDWCPSEHVTSEAFDHLFVLAHYIQEVGQTQRKRNRHGIREVGQLQGPDEHDHMAASSRGFELKQVTFAYLPDFNLLLSVDGTGMKGWTNVKRLVRNRRCLVRQSNQAAVLLASMLDGMVDEVYPLLTFYGDSLEGLQTHIIEFGVTEEHVVLRARPFPVK